MSTRRKPTEPIRITGELAKPPAILSDPIELSIGGVPITGWSAMPGVVATLLQLVRQGHTPERACCLCATAVGATWGGSTGPAEMAEDPTAYPVDRAILRALGYDVPSELPLAVALGLEPDEPAAESEEA